MTRIVVLGAGMVGRAIIDDLAAQYEVLAMDRDPRALEKCRARQVETQAADLSDPDTITEATAAADLVVGAVPGFMGRQTLKTVLQVGKPVVDISFFLGDTAELDQLAKDRGVVAVMDAGVAPGMSNFILGHHAAAMDVHGFRCVVGGLPRVRTWPWQYKAPFSPIDVLEEYTRPARFRERGQEVVRPALSEPERMDFPGIGSLEAFNTDGLRTLLDSYPDIPNMVEKTLRYHGHRELMEILRESGFLSTEPVKVNDSNIIPLDLTARLLFDQWELKDGEEEFTVMRIDVEGEEQGTPIHYRYDLLDRTDPVGGWSSMSRTTGYACTAMVDLVLAGKIKTPGLHPLEDIGAVDGSFPRVMDYLRDRNVVYEMTRLEGE